MKVCKPTPAFPLWIAFLAGLAALLSFPVPGRAETVLEYVGPALKRLGGDFDPPSEVTAVHAIIVLHDGVQTSGISLAGHSRLSHEGKVFKRAELTIGRTTYAFQLGAYMDGDLNLRFDAVGNVVDWQIRYFGHYDDIALYGPGSVRPRAVPTHPNVPTAKECRNADVVASKDRVIRAAGEPRRDYRAIGCGQGKWTVVRRGLSTKETGRCTPGMLTLQGFDPDIVAAWPSRDGGPKTSIEFTNLNLWPVSIFWVDTKGDLVSKVNKLDPMSSIKLDTRGGHGWLAIDQKTGRPQVGFTTTDFCTNYAYVFRPASVPNEMTKEEVSDWQVKAAYGYAVAFELGSRFPACKLACGAAADFYKFLGDHLLCHDKPIDDEKCRDKGFLRQPDGRILPTHQR